MPPTWGALTAISRPPLFLGDAFLTRAGAPDTAFWAQVVVFNVVFAIVAVLGHRLREAGMEQETLAIELKRVRLEADDILRNIRSGVLTVDGVGRLAFINPTAQKLLDLDGEGLIGMPVLDQLKTRSSELWAAVVAGIRNGRKISRGEGMVMHQGGRIFPIGLSTTTFRQETQEAPSVTAIFTDISDLKEVQELQARAERLESVAALSASLAHEIRNPLASIRSSVEQLARLQARRRGRAVPGRAHRPGERPAEPAAERVPRLRPGAGHPVRAAGPARRGGRGGAADPGPSRVPARRGDHDRGRPHHAGRRRGPAAPGHRQPGAQRGAGGARPDPDHGERRRRCSVGEIPHGTNLDHAVRLQVRDSGPGIPEDIRERLFEPFVSGRPGGSGLGLAIVQRAVQAHHGLVLVDSTPGAGTTFTIFLPAKMIAEDAA